MIETESRMVVARGWGKGKGKRTKYFGYAEIMGKSLKQPSEF